MNMCDIEKKESVCEYFLISLELVLVRCDAPNNLNVKDKEHSLADAEGLSCSM